MIKSIKNLPSVFWVSALVTTGLIILSIFNTEYLRDQIQLLNKYIFSTFGDFYLWFILLSLVVFILIGASPLGKIRIGGENAKPKHSFFSWFSMLFCAGIGIGLLFWGGAEPLYFFLHPPLETGSLELSKESTAFMFAFFHWGFHPWAIYGLTTLLICFYSMNMKRGIYFSSFLSKNSDNKFLKLIIDNITVIAILFGIVVTFGMGVVQFEGGLHTVFNVKESFLTEIIIIVLITICYMISTLRGLDSGIKVLSNISMGLSFILLGAIIFALPLTEFVLPIIKSFPSYISNIYDLSTGNMAFQDSNFLREWTTKYWAWWIAWAPFVGIFVSLISKGRTVRELVFSMLITPALFSIMWFTVFGKAAIFLNSHKVKALQSIDFENTNVILFKIMENLFSGDVFVWLALLLVAVFFINSADSATYTLAAISQKAKGSVTINKNNEIEIKTPPTMLQISWGVLFSVLAALFLFVGGLEILQNMTLITVLPFSLLLFVVFIKLVYDMTIYYRRSKENNSKHQLEDAELILNEAHD